MLHEILEVEVSERASSDLDNLTVNGNFLVDREENHLVDNRQIMDRWVGHIESESINANLLE